MLDDGGKQLPKIRGGHSLNIIALQLHEGLDEYVGI
jgi:hypothetical protein